MTGNRNRSVVRRPDGRWANKRHGTARATSLHVTQAEAVQAAREALGAGAGGELLIHDRNGRIRRKHTIPPASDPFPPRG